MPAAVITGASQGLGRATARALAGRGWSLIVDARHAARLAAAVARAGHGDRDAGRRDRPRAPGRDRRVGGHRAGRLDLLVNNASRLGPSPLPALRGYPLDELAESTRPTCWRRWR